VRGVGEFNPIKQCTVRTLKMLYNVQHSKRKTFFPYKSDLYLRKKLEKRFRKVLYSPEAWALGKANQK
jgi:hypothetical protein